MPMEFSRQEYLSGVLFPIPGDLPNPEIKPTSLVSPALAGRFFTTPQKPKYYTPFCTCKENSSLNSFDFFFFFGCTGSLLQHAVFSSMWDLSSPTRDQTCVSCIGRQIPDHWTTRDVPIPNSFYS